MREYYKYQKLKIKSYFLNHFKIINKTLKDSSLFLKFSEDKKIIILIKPIKRLFFEGIIYFLNNIWVNLGIDSMT